LILLARQRTFFLRFKRLKNAKEVKMENLKKMAGIKAAEFVTDGMVVGLGTGSTAYYFVEEIGRRIKEEGLQIIAVTTSSVTSQQAEGLGIPLKSIDEVDLVDVTVDGADEVDPNFNGIKGGGGALLMEKVVATPTKSYIWVVDESKLVDKLGAFKLPVEVVQYGAEQVFRRFERAGYKPSFRQKDGQRFVTDMQNFIIDLDLGVIENPVEFARELDHIVGVVEHGLFNQMVDKVIVAGKAGVQVLEANK
jgi:ribose 5-phosphate isomerase A